MGQFLKYSNFPYASRRVIFSEIRNDTEPNTKYVRVLDPRATEISFVRTDCPKKETLYVSCSNLGKIHLLANKQTFFFAKFVDIVFHRMRSSIHTVSKYGYELVENGCPR